MNLLWSIAGTVSAIAAVYVAFLLIRLWKANPENYRKNLRSTGNLYNAAAGQVTSLMGNGTPDFSTRNFVVPCVSDDGNVTWERSASLSDEAVDSVLARH